MSFILDALRKSDAERQRAATPGLADVRYAARPARRSVWVPVLAVVLAVNAVVLAFLFLRDRPEPAAPAPAPAGPVEPAAPAAAAEPAPIRPLAREAEFPEALPDVDVEGEFAPPATAGTSPVPAPVVMEAPELPDPGAAPAPPVATPAPAPAGPPPAPSRIVSGNELPTAEQLMATGALNTPMLNLDLHVYSDAPGGRFVVINSRKYKEGGQLSEGPRVESITRDGVILSIQGRRFTLSRK